MRIFEFWRGGTRSLIVFLEEFAKGSLILSRDNSVAASNFGIYFRPMWPKTNPKIGSGEGVRQRKSLSNMPPSSTKRGGALRAPLPRFCQGDVSLSDLR